MAFYDKLIVSAVFVIVCLSLRVSAQAYCHQQNCRECDKAAEQAIGESVKCDVKSQVTVAWLNETANPNLNLTGMNVTSEFSCLKMVGSKKNTDENGESTDVIRGCVLKTIANATCNSLKTLQEKRSKEAICLICEGNNCNGAIATYGSILMLISTLLLTKLINH